MFKCMLWSNYTCNITRHVRVSTGECGKSKKRQRRELAARVYRDSCYDDPVSWNARGGHKDTTKSFVEAFQYVLERTRMDIERKMKELEELFTKTGKELGDIVKKNEEFVAAELRKAHRAVQDTVEECSKGQMERLQAVKGTYDGKMKICNEKAASGLGAVKTRFDMESQKAEKLRTAMKQILKECLDTNDFIKCVASRTKEAVQRRREITESLNDAVKNAESSAAQQLKEAVKCHAEAQVEALKSLQQILRDTKDCVSKMQ